MAEDRPIFHSEADLQYSLALTLKEMHQDAKVRLEYPVRLITKETADNRALDIWIENMRIPIELKYTNKKLTTSYDGEEFSLKTSRIHNYRYFFVDDVKRIEDLVWDTKVKKGYAIIVTNNASMWSRGRGNSVDFSLHDTLEGELTWHGEKSPKKKPIRLRNKYPLYWKEYSRPNNIRFRYMVVKVVKE